MLQQTGTDATLARKSLLYEGQKRTLAELIAGMDDDARWILLVGPEGSGKSIILGALLAELRASDADVVVCDGSEVVEPEALAAVLRGRLHLPPPTPTFLGRGGPSDDIVASRRSRNSPLAVLVDNADGLSPKSLKLLGELVSRTTADQGGAWVVLAGPESLVEPAVRAAGRVKHIRCTPAPLTGAEVAQYIDRRLRTEGDDAVKVPREALREIARYTKGLPGHIDALCDVIVTKPTVRLSNEVSVEVVQEAAGRLGLDPNFEAPRRKPPEPQRHDATRNRRHWRLALVVVALTIAVTALTALAYLYGERVVRTSREWITHTFFPPEPPKPEPVATAKGRPRQTRREPTPSAASTVRSTAAKPGTERRPGAEQAEAASRPERAKPAPPPITPEQIAGLIAGARTGRDAEVTRLLAAGVSPDVRDASGVTALMQAILHGHAATARVLLDKGAQVNARDRGGITPVMLAVIHEQAEALQLLLDRKAVVNARSGAGWTALTFAAWKGDPDLVRTLLAHGAQRNVVDKQGWSPLDYATAPLQAPAAELDASGAPAPPPRGRHAEVITLLQGRPTP